MTIQSQPWGRLAPPSPSGRLRAPLRGGACAANNSAWTTTCKTYHRVIDYE